MDDLTAFLRAQWDAEEQKALNWQRHHHALTDQFMNDPRRNHVRPRREPLTDAQIAEYAFKSTFDPARVLAEVEAKRRILDEHAHIPGDGINFTLAEQTRAEETLKLLALPYADVDGYEEEWKP